VAVVLVNGIYPSIGFCTTASQILWVKLVFRKQTHMSQISKHWRKTWRYL